MISPQPHSCFHLWREMLLQTKSFIEGMISTSAVLVLPNLQALMTSNQFRLFQFPITGYQRLPIHKKSQNKINLLVRMMLVMKKDGMHIQCQISNVKCYAEHIFPFIFEKELKEHVMVNNWENGWILDQTTRKLDNQITIIYLPQLLEYLGFMLLTCIFGILLLR